MPGLGSVVAGSVERWARSCQSSHWASQPTADPNGVDAKVGLPVPNIVVAEPAKRWGSVAKNGAVRVNWRVLQCPVSLVDYVVAHELVHLLHEDHSRAFWATLGRVMPDYEERKERLDGAAAGVVTAGLTNSRTASHRVPVLAGLCSCGCSAEGSHLALPTQPPRPGCSGRSARPDSCRPKRRAIVVVPYRMDRAASTSAAGATGGSLGGRLENAAGKAAIPPRRRPRPY